MPQSPSAVQVFRAQSPATHANACGHVAELVHGSDWHRCVAKSQVWPMAHGVVGQPGTHSVAPGVHAHDTALHTAPAAQSVSAAHWAEPGRQTPHPNDSSGALHTIAELQSGASWQQMGCMQLTSGHRLVASDVERQA